ncbi:hypothetical protein Bcep1808_5503 [Burkholderia vietnamiensis G4]|uniref:Uncharacterized protein n=1 Tax=Burkholderia vietnamiensis (strain G4 / LMG 22486) TaxID=269482 RepID=A4JQ94_BURVG|nr:hypothetical protein Bcep1808_5503 [Burkholderia vietnamiensis G4]
MDWGTILERRCTVDWSRSFFWRDAARRMDAEVSAASRRYFQCRGRVSLLGRRLTSAAVADADDSVFNEGRRPNDVGRVAELP